MKIDNELVILHWLSKLHKFLKPYIYLVTLTVGLLFSFYILSQLNLESYVVRIAVPLVILYWFLYGAIKIIKMLWKRDTSG